MIRTMIRGVEVKKFVVCSNRTKISALVALQEKELLNVMLSAEEN